METQFITHLPAFQTANQLELDQDLVMAENFYLNAIQRGERLSDAYFGLARIQLKMKRPDDAIKSFEKAINSKIIHKVSQLAQKHGFSNKFNMESPHTLWLWFTLLLLEEKEGKLAITTMNEANKWRLFEGKV